MPRLLNRGPIAGYGRLVPAEIRVSSDPLNIASGVTQGKPISRRKVRAHCSNCVKRRIGASKCGGRALRHSAGRAGGLQVGTGDMPFLPFPQVNCPPDPVRRAFFWVARQKRRHGRRRFGENDFTSRLVNASSRPASGQRRHGTRSASQARPTPGGKDHRMSDAQDPLLVEACPGYRVLTLNRPAKLNAFDAALHAALRTALAAAAADPACRAVLLAGAGRAFCAGQDLAEPGMTGPDTDLEAVLERGWNPLVRAIRALPKPVVCAVQGVAAAPAPRSPSPATSPWRLRMRASPRPSSASAWCPIRVPPGPCRGWPGRSGPAPWRCWATRSRARRPRATAWCGARCRRPRCWRRRMRSVPGWRGCRRRGWPPSKQAMEAAEANTLDAQLLLGGEAAARARPQRRLRRGCRGLPGEARGAVRRRTGMSAADDRGGASAAGLDRPRRP